MSFPYREQAAVGPWPVGLSVLGVVALSVVAFSVVPGRVVLVPGLVSVAPAAGLVLPATILFGPVGAWGIALGYVLADGLAGALGALTVVGALGQLALGYVGADLWRRFGSTPAGVKGVRDAGAFGLAALVGAVAATAAVGWAGAALGRVPFLVAALSLPSLFLATLAVGLPVLVVATRVRGFLPDNDSLPRLDPLARPRVLVPVVLGWAVVATVVSVGFQVFATVPASGVRTYGLGALLVFRNSSLVGPNVATIQSVLGGLAIAALAVTTLHERSPARE